MLRTVFILWCVLTSKTFLHVFFPAVSFPRLCIDQGSCWCQSGNARCFPSLLRFPGLAFCFSCLCRRSLLHHFLQSSAIGSFSALPSLTFFLVLFFMTLSFLESTINSLSIDFPKIRKLIILRSFFSSVPMKILRYNTDQMLFGGMQIRCFSCQYRGFFYRRVINLTHLHLTYTLSYNQGS